LWPGCEGGEAKREAEQELLPVEGG
jgi:hypothetical protein